jgi:hypothetical protein
MKSRGIQREKRFKIAESDTTVSSKDIRIGQGSRREEEARTPARTPWRL